MLFLLTKGKSDILNTILGVDAMKTKSLYNEILSYIDSHREDDYWDLKQEHHKNTAELLHDIICMANNRADRDAYIIYGVVDKTYEIIGVEADLGRKTQQQMIDQLKSKKFAGGVRPKIEVHTLAIANHEVDILVIKNTSNTPYYLTESYRDREKEVRANHIYTRVGDTNTDIDKSADINYIEYLWKKRFGLHMTPFEKLQWLLDDKENWVHDQEQHYNRLYPEFTLIYDETEQQKTPEFYAYVMMNYSTYDTIIRANYFGTTLYSRQVVILDSGRYETVVPEWGFLHFDKYHRDTITFKYFIQTDISYAIHQYLLDEDSHEAVYAHDRFMDVVLLFTTELEKDMFIAHACSNKGILEALMNKNDSTYSWIESHNELAHNKIVEEIKASMALKQMLVEYRKSGGQNE